MSGEHATVSPEFLASVQPIVLVGGKSRRFGRDKLREPWGEPGRVLVQRPIEALRSIFGPRVKLVGDCHSSILPLADGVIPDEHAGVGPMGGIVSALKQWRGPVFVLAGDMPNFATSDGWSILRAAEHRRDCLAALAATERPHPCVGLYSAAALPVLTDCLARGKYQLAVAIPEHAKITVPVDPSSAANVNTCPDES